LKPANTTAHTKTATPLPFCLDRTALTNENTAIKAVLILP